MLEFISVGSYCCIPYIVWCGNYCFELHDSFFGQSYLATPSVRYCEYCYCYISSLFVDTEM